MKRLLVPAMVFVSAVLCFEQFALAQRPARSSYRPSRPTLSPWFNLYRSEGGALDNYHSFVRPEQQLRRTLTQQESAIRQQGASLRTLGGQMSSMQQAYPTRPTGTGSTFMNFSHYYSFGGGR